MTETLVAPSDFDFLYGKWHVHNRRRRQWLAGCEDWDEFEATSTAWPILDGLGNMDEFKTSYQGGFTGTSFRLFQPESGEWSIYWASTRHPGVLEPPVRGRIGADTGMFSGADVFEGRRILVRFLWSGVSTPAPRWDQEFSVDGGSTWESNWVMDFTRM